MMDAPAGAILGGEDRGGSSCVEMGGGPSVEEGARLSIPNRVLIRCVPLGLS